MQQIAWNPTLIHKALPNTHLEVECVRLSKELPNCHLVKPRAHMQEAAQALCQLILTDHTTYGGHVTEAVGGGGSSCSCSGGGGGGGAGEDGHQTRGLRYVR
eukprot:scaffold140914_cov19-Tisochrysis_lutea.AAC.1